MDYILHKDPEADPNQKSSFLDNLDKSTQLSGQYQLFGLFFGLGVFFMFLSLFFIPYIPVSPSKFASLSALGSISMFFSLIFLKGIKSCLEGMFEGDRKMYAIGYGAALFLTYLSSMVFRNYFAALLGAMAQVFSKLTKIFRLQRFLI